MSKCTECISRNGYCPQDRTMTNTNAGRIRNMTDEELAKFLDKVSDGCDGCPNRRKCMFEICEDPADTCAETWHKWLKEEAEE